MNRSKRIFPLILMLLLFVAAAAMQTFAYSPAEGAWLPSTETATFSKKMGRVFDACKPQLYGSGSAENYDCHPVAYFAKIPPKYEGYEAPTSEYAFLYKINNKMIAGDPGQLKIAEVSVDSSSGELVLLRNSVFDIKKYAEDSSTEPIGDFSDEWAPAADFEGSELWNASYLKLKSTFEEVTAEIKGYEFKAICSLGYRISKLSMIDKETGEEIQSQKERTVLCYTKDVKNNAVAVQVLTIAMEDEKNKAKALNLSTVLAEPSFNGDVFNPDPLTASRTSYELGTYGTGLIAPPYEVSNPLVSAESSDDEVIGAWVLNDEKFFNLEDGLDYRRFFFLNPLNHKEGEATVTLTDIYGQTIELAVTVVDNWPVPDFGTDAITMRTRETRKLEYTPIWGGWIDSVASSDSEVAEAAIEGGEPETQYLVIKAKEAGSAVITAKTSRGKEAKIRVTVKSVPQCGNDYLNTIVVKARAVSVKYSKLKKKAQKVPAAKAFDVKKAVGKVSYEKISGNKKITISRRGQVKVKKGLKKGTYKVKVAISASGNDVYSSGGAIVTLKLKVE